MTANQSKSKNKGKQPYLADILAIKGTLDTIGDPTRLGANKERKDLSVDQEEKMELLELSVIKDNEWGQSS